MEKNARIYIYYYINKQIDKYRYIKEREIEREELVAVGAEMAMK